jgi:hypothetical protein
MLWGNSASSTKLASRPVIGFSVASLEESLRHVDELAKVPAEAETSASSAEPELDWGTSLEHYQIWIAPASPTPAENDVIDVCSDIVQKTVAALCRISRIKSEIANDVRQKGQYMANMANAYVVLSRNIARAANATSSEQALRALAIAIRDFCAFEASFGYFKDMSVWNTVRLAQEKLISDADREKLRYFYKNFAYMSDNVTQHNKIAKTAADQALDVLNRHTGTVSQAARRLAEAINAIQTMGVAYRGFLNALREKFG